MICTIPVPKHNCSHRERRTSYRRKWCNDLLRAPCRWSRTRALCTANVPLCMCCESTTLGHCRLLSVGMDEADTEKKRDSPGVALLHDAFSGGVKDVVVLAGTLVPLHTASPAVLQQALRTHAAAPALLTGLRGQTTTQSVTRQAWILFFFEIIYLELMSMYDPRSIHSLTQSLS